MKHHLLIDGWRSNIRFSACHMLLRHDKCSRLHGHSYAIHLKIEGDLDENHMLADFGNIKKVLRKLADELDHRTLIPTMNPDIIVETDDQNQIVTVDMLGKRYSFPICDIIKIPVYTTTVEELSKYFLERVISEAELPRSVTSTSIGVDEGWGQGAWSTETVQG